MKNELTENKINQFTKLIQQGIDAWQDAGTLLIEMIKSDSKIFDKIIAKDPRLNASILGRFEQIGRKVLHPYLLISDSPAASKLATMPYSVQERYLNEPVPLIIETGNGIDTILVDIKNMSNGQANQAFGRGIVRTSSQQRAWLLDRASKTAKTVKEKNRPLYMIKNGKVHFNQDAEFSLAELVKIMAALAK